MRKLYEAWSELEDKSASTLAEFCRNSIISSHIPGYQNDCQYFSANLHTYSYDFSKLFLKEFAKWHYY